MFSYSSQALSWSGTDILLLVALDVLYQIIFYQIDMFLLKIASDVHKKNIYIYIFSC